MSDLSSATVGTLIKIPADYSSGFSISAVKSVTAANVTLESGTRARVKDGLVSGTSDSWRRKYASIATDADVLANRIACAKSRLALINVTPENIEVIEGLLRG